VKAHQLYASNLLFVNALEGEPAKDEATWLALYRMMDKYDAPIILFVGSCRRAKPLNSRQTEGHFRANYCQRGEGPSYK
jgi:hypothetical protein